MRGMQSLADAVAAAGINSDRLEDAPVPLDFQTDLASEKMARRAAVLGMSDQMIRQAAIRGREAAYKGAEFCDSPIEKRLLPWLIFEDYGDNFLTIPAEVHTPKSDVLMTEADLFIVPQFAFAKYRLDFAIVGVIGRTRHILCVECDGEGFHQGEWDRRRDAYLAGWGIPTIRFSGSEIHQYPGGASARVAGAFRELVEGQS